MHSANVGYRNLLAIKPFELRIAINVDNFHLKFELWLHQLQGFDCALTEMAAMTRVDSDHILILPS
jgi:hypothetical protein